MKAGIVTKSDLEGKPTEDIRLLDDVPMGSLLKVEATDHYEVKMEIMNLKESTDCEELKEHLNIEQVGWLIHRNSKYITLSPMRALTIDCDPEEAHGYGKTMSRIIKSCIVKFEILEDAIKSTTKV